MAFRTRKPFNQVAPSPELQIAPDKTGAEPELGLLRAVFDHCNLSQKLLHSVFRWAEKKPGFQSLTRGNCRGDLVSSYTIAILITRYTRAGNMELLDILLNGWSRSRKLKHADRLWLEMKKKNVKTSIVTYDTLVGGYSWTRRVERAFELADEMKREGIKSNATVCNPIIDALAEAGRFRFKEVLWIMENFFLCETVPTISTCNSYVKGYSKLSEKRRDVMAKSLKILTMMISWEVFPNPMVYVRGETGQISKEMRDRRCDMDMATTTTSTPFLCKMHRFEEAFADMLGGGIVLRHLTFHRLNDEFRNRE
ncbi:pentatricopeptide repeat-containing protein [Salix suchowensis]|nr:pentatricopeptide repeat-containing protein [Salix suchowensis]